LQEYLSALDAALEKARDAGPPIAASIESLRAGNAPLSLAECKRLAYVPYQDIVTIQSTSRTGQVSTHPPSVDFQTADLQAALDRCPADARVERARLSTLQMIVIYEKEHQDGGPVMSDASSRLKATVRELLAMMNDYQLVEVAKDVMPYADQTVLALAEKTGVAQPAELQRLRERWSAAQDAELDARADDASLSVTDRLLAIEGKLIRAKGRDAQGRIPGVLADEALRRVQAALADPRSAAEHSSIVVAVLPILGLLGERERAKALIAKEIETSATPYYYMSRMAQIEEELGHLDVAIDWFKRAYREAKGPATRFQWGAGYLEALLRLKPDDESAVRTAAVEVLGELEGPKRIYGTTRSSLALLNTLLQKWSAAGGHASALLSIREHMRGVCDKIPSAENEAGAACEAFLKPGA